MAYQVLYRKYRPQSFKDVVGQPQVTLTLQNELQAGRVSHAYLFTGSRGTGKTTCARILSKAVNCLDLQNGDPCLQCEICKGIENGSVMDVVEIDAASNNGVDSIRSLIEEASFTPSKAKYRVYIIDEVHMLSDSAFNALLKTLEEPPEHVVFILGTTEVHRLLPTILSRCQRFDFKRITPIEIAERLKYVCECENVEIEDDAALLIATIADGGMRDALSILDQCIGRSRKVTNQVVRDTAGIVGRDHLFNLCDSIKDKDSTKALEIINELYSNSKDMMKLCSEVSDHLRKLMLIKTMKKPEVLFTVPQDEMVKLNAQAMSMGLAEIINAMDLMRDCLDKMRFANQRIELEMAFVRLCAPEMDTSMDAILRRIEALEKNRPLVTENAVTEIKEKVKEEGLRPKETLPEKKEEPITEESPVSAAPAVSDKERSLIEKAVPFNEWPEVLNKIKEYSRATASAFHNSSAYVSGDYMLIEGSDLAFELLRKGSNKDKVREAIFSVTGRNFRLGPYRAAKAQAKEEENPIDALVRKAKDAGITVTEH